jgi:8-oxo-dGTP pyrophosphatase MutT (NUDIX family)
MTSVLQSVSIIPFALEDATQTIYILLARIASRRPGPSTWGDLGGTPELGESPFETAAREFEEETLSAVHVAHLRHSDRTQQHQIVQQLKTGHYFLHVRLHFHLEGTGDFHRDFYLKQVPFDPSVSRRFAQTREALLCVTEGSNPDTLPSSIRTHPAILHSTNCIVAPRFLEKSALRWLSLDHIMDLIQHQGQYRDIRLKSSFVPALRVATGELLRFIPET